MTRFAVLAKAEQEYDYYGRPEFRSFFGTGARYAVTQTEYDAAGRLECTIQRMNPAEFNSLPPSCARDTDGADGPDRIVHYDYNPGDEMFAVKSAYGVSGLEQTTRYTEYTANGLVASVSDANNNKTSYQYDGYDRLYRTFYPDPSTPGTSSSTDYEQQTLDINGNVTSHRLRNGQSLNYAYDGLNNVTAKSGATITTVNYSYDVAGRMTQAAGGLTVAFGYDVLSRKTSETQPFGSTGYSYDAAGRRTQLRWDNASVLYVDYDYLTTGEVSAIRENGATTGIGVLARYGYDDLGQRVQLVRGNGATTSYSYDATQRLGCILDNLTGGSTNNCTPTASGFDQATTFTYNPASQLKTVARANDVYAFSQNVNVNRNYAANGLNQYVAIDSQVHVSPTYDAKGNLLSGGSAAGTGAYAYTEENQLSSVVPTPGAGTVSLFYDPVGRLAEYDTDSSTRFLYDGPDIIAEIANVPGSPVLRRYVHGPGADEPLVWYEGSGTSTRRWYHADERGSIVAISDASGNALYINAYDSWGKPASFNTGRFQYTGQTWFPEIGLYNYKARFYSPQLGRFLQTDPIGYEDGMNWYAYVGNDPVNGRDPTGLVNEPNPNVKPVDPPPAEMKDGTSDNILVEGSHRISGVSGTIGGDKATNGEGAGNVPDTPQKQQDDNKDCGLVAALAKNKQALIGDSIGFGASFLPGGKPAVALAGVALGAGILTNTALTSNTDRPALSGGAIALGIAGVHIASAGPLAEAYKATSFLAKNLPGIGSIVAGGALILDAANVYQDYKPCK